MLALGARLAAITAASLGWLLMVVLPVTGLALMAGGLFGTRPPGPLAADWAQRGMAVGVGIWLWQWVKLRLSPVGYRVTRLFGSAREIGTVQVGRHGAGRRLWVAPGARVQGYALAGLGRGAVVLSEPAARLPGPELRWLLAHELSHLERGDAAASLWWVAGMRTLGLGVSLSGFLVRVTARLPLIGLIARTYYGLADRSLRTALWLFRLIDRAVGRAMEYRADRDAALAASPLAGVRLLGRLSCPLEPDFGLFATHPPTATRIKRLERLAGREPGHGGAA